MSAIFAGIAFLLSFIVIEGCASTTLTVYDLAFNPDEDLRSRVHAQPDTLLGWSNLPGFAAEDMYGPGIGLHINDQGLRGQRNIPHMRPAGKLRVLCSGDSFTLGIGVADEDTWCARLEQLDSRLETVNLGQAGYGVDQQYLLYRRTAARLRHDVHVLAFIRDDLRRMTLRSYVGYGKPYFTWDDERPSLHNVPVGRPSRLAVWNVRNRGTIADMRVMRLADRALNRLRRQPTNERGAAAIEARKTALHLFEDLAARARENGAMVVFVLLEQRVPGSDEGRATRDFFVSEMANRGLTFIDLWSEFRGLPADTLEAMFDRRWAHYSTRGNQFVAGRLLEHFARLPEFRERVAELTPGAAALDRLD